MHDGTEPAVSSAGIDMDSSASTNPAAPEPPPPPSLESADEPLRLHAQLLACVRESVVASDLEGRILYWGPGAERMYGYKASEVLCKPYRNFAGAIDPPDEAAFRRDLLARGYWEGQHLQKRRNGQTFWTETHISVFTDDQGQPAGFVGIDRDISGHKQAEEKLRVNLERLQDIAANIPGAIYQLQTGRTGALEVPYMSSGCEALFERPVAEMDFTGLLFDRMHVGDRALFEHSLAKAAEQMERWSLEFRVVPPEGSAKWLRGSANPRQTPPGGILWNGVLLDITELKRTEESLREREAFQNLLMDTIPTPVFYKDRQGRYLGFNKAFETLFGMTKEQLVGKSVFNIAPPELAKIYHAKDLELFEHPGTQVYEAPIQDAQGNRHDVVLHKAPIVNAQGAVSGLIGIMLDVTQRKQAEEQMAKHLDELRRWQTVTLGRESRVAEMKREVNALSVRLGQPPPYPSAEGASPVYSPHKVAMHA